MRKVLLPMLCLCLAVFVVGCKSNRSPLNIFASSSNFELAFATKENGIYTEVTVFDTPNNVKLSAATTSLHWYFDVPQGQKEYINVTFYSDAAGRDLPENIYFHLHSRDPGPQ